MKPVSDLYILGTRGLPARYGGFETLAEVLWEGLSRANLRVHVVPTVSSSKKSLLHKYIGTIVGTYKSARTCVNPDTSSVLVMNPINTFTALLLKRKGFSVVLHMDGRDDLRQKWALPIRLIYKLVQRIASLSGLCLVFDSKAVRQHFEPWIRGQREVIAYGTCRSCGGQSQWESALANEEFLVLGRPEPENQIHLIVDSFEIAEAPGRLRVITQPSFDDRYWKSLRSKIENSSRTELVIGEWDRSRLCSQYQNVSAVIHGHSVGGTNPSLLLALCHGTPVLAHDNPYNREVAGSLARYWRDEKELVHLLKEFDKRQWISDQSCRNRLCQDYDWARVVEHFAILLRLRSSQAELDKETSN